MKQTLMQTVKVMLVFITMLSVWQLIVSAAHLPPYILPGPQRVALAVLSRGHDLLLAFAVTAEEAALGLAASLVVGVALSLVFAQWRWMRELVYPYTIFLQTVPIVAIAPLILMWAGPGTASVALVAFIICLAPIIANTTQGLVSVEQNLVHLFLMHKASSMQILLKLRLPHALPNLFVGLRIASGIAVIGAITGELFAGSSRVGQGGIGYSILYASAQMETDYLFALVSMATLLGLTFFFVGAVCEWYFLHAWHESSRSRMME